MKKAWPSCRQRHSKRTWVKKWGRVGLTRLASRQLRASKPKIWIKVGYKMRGQERKTLAWCITSLSSSYWIIKFKWATSTPQLRATPSRWHETDSSSIETRSRSFLCRLTQPTIHNQLSISTARISPQSPLWTTEGRAQRRTWQTVQKPREQPISTKACIC